ncbi:MAG: hypothetical protein KatS3mg089_0595 [Patescibacteria group bacterium]|nr:MAG: hypothetical protein KatS3mg089_0595 [Patescibacteria group bacterium]
MGEKEKMYSEFLEVSKQTGVPIKKVLDVFWHLSRGETIENNELVRMVGVSRNALNQVKKALSAYLNHPSKETSLRKDIAERVSRLYDNNFLVEEDLLRTLTTSEVYEQSVTLLSRYKDRRTVPKRSLDQLTATIETIGRRVALLDFFGDVKDKQILFLGDDDFTSVATANLKSAQDITVVDIDERILDNIGAISDKLNLRIKRVKHDLREPIPAELKGKFDTVFTDPPYTPEGIQLFVSRALDAIDQENRAARIYFCYGNSDRAKERFLPIQNAITGMGLMLRWIFDRFNRYEGAESVGSASSLYVAEVTPMANPIIRGNYDKPIYTID